MMITDDATSCPMCRKILEKPADELVWEFPHSIVFLGPWQYFTGYCVLVGKRHVAELFDLSAAERHGVIDELALMASVIARVVKPRKINYEWLGNQVPHMHWHLFPRQESEPGKLKAAWVTLEDADKDDAQEQLLQTGVMSREQTIAALRRELEKLGKIQS